MTATRKQRRSLVQERESTSPFSMAAATAAVGSVSLLNEAFKKSGLLQSDLARILNLSEGRISQVLNGDGNVRVSTLARFLRAMDRSLKIEDGPLTESTNSPNQLHASSTPKYAAYKTATWFDGEKLARGDVIEFSDSHPSERLAEEYRYVVNIQTGATEEVSEEIVKEPSKQDLSATKRGATYGR